MSSADVLRWALLTEPLEDVENQIKDKGTVRAGWLELLGLSDTGEMILWPFFYDTNRIEKLINLMRRFDPEFYPITYQGPLPVLQSSETIPNWKIRFNVEDLLNAPARERMDAAINLRKWLLEVGADPDKFDLPEPDKIT